MLKQIASSLSKKKQMLNKKLPCFHSTNIEFLSNASSPASHTMSQVDIGALHKAVTEATLHVNNNSNFNSNGNGMTPSPLVSFVLDLTTNQMTTSESHSGAAISSPSYFFIEQEDYPILYEELLGKHATGDLLRMKNRSSSSASLEKLMEHVQHCGFEVNTTTEIYFPNELQNKNKDASNDNNNNVSTITTLSSSSTTTSSTSTSPQFMTNQSFSSIYQDDVTSSFSSFSSSCQDGILDTLEGLERKNRNYKIHGHDDLVVIRSQEKAATAAEQESASVIRQLSYLVQQLSKKQSTDRYSVVMNKNSFALYNGSIPILTLLVLKGRPYIRHYTYGLQKRRDRFYRREEQHAISQEEYDRLVNVFVGSKKLVVVEPENVETLVQNLSLFDKLLTHHKNVRVNIPFLSELRKKQQQQASLITTSTSQSSSSTNTTAAAADLSSSETSSSLYEQALEWFYKHRNYSKLNHWNCITVDENAQAKNPKAKFLVCNQETVAEDFIASLL